MKQSIRRYLGAATVAAIIANVAAIAPIAVAADTISASSTTKTKMTARQSNLIRFQLRGVVNSIGSSSVSIHVTGTSKNVVSLKNTDQTLSLVRTTKVTKKGKKTVLNSLTPGTKVKVFGLYNKASSSIQKIQWIKAI